MSNKPDYGFWKLWNLSFGFFGVQIAYALQSAQVSRIFSTIGADPHDLSYFWILPPLMGLIVQPIVGMASDKTWNRFGRRLPYLLLGAVVAIIVMCFLPNAGSLGLNIGAAIVFGLIMLMFLDTSINMAMQPFKMLVGDFVNEKQKTLAYSIQSFLCNAGSLVGYLAPIFLALFLANTAPAGEVPPTVTWSFYIGAIVLALCVVYTMVKVKEMPPAEYKAYHGITDEPAQEKKKENIFRLLVKAPKVFWTIGLVQFFCWAAFLYMWSYSTDAIANQSFGAPSVEHITGIEVDGKSYTDKYLFNSHGLPVIDDGKLAIAGIEVDGTFAEPKCVVVDGDTLVNNGKVVYNDGVAAVSPDNGVLAKPGQVVIVDGQSVNVTTGITTVSRLALVEPGEILTLAHMATLDNATNTYELEQTSEVKPGDHKLVVTTNTVLNAASKQYQDAGDWIGVLFAIQAIVAVIWAAALSRFTNRRLAYSLSLLIGAVGFMSIYFFTNKYLLGVSYGLIGCAWAAILAMPFTILTNALSGNHIGTYLGLFNCTICIPQIVAALCGGALLSLFPVTASGAPNTVWMLVIAGVLLAIGSLAVWNIRETSGK